MAITSGHSKLAKELKDALGLPKNTIRFELSAGIGELMKIKVEYYPEESGIKINKMKSFIREYNINKDEKPKRMIDIDQGDGK